MFRPYKVSLRPSKKTDPRVVYISLQWNINNSWFCLLGGPEDDLIRLKHVALTKYTISWLLLGLISQSIFLVFACERLGECRGFYWFISGQCVSCFLLRSVEWHPKVIKNFVWGGNGALILQKKLSVGSWQSRCNLICLPNISDEPYRHSNVFFACTCYCLVLYRNWFQIN